MKSLQSVWRLLIAGFVVFSITAAGNTLYADWASACDGPGEIGACPDGTTGFKHEMCDCVCEKMFSVPGLCNVDNCCECAT